MIVLETFKTAQTVTITAKGLCVLMTSAQSSSQFDSNCRFTLVFYDILMWRVISRLGEDDSRSWPTAQQPNRGTRVAARPAVRQKPREIKAASVGPICSSALLCSSLKPALHVWTIVEAGRLILLMTWTLWTIEGCKNMKDLYFRLRDVRARQ